MAENSERATPADDQGPNTGQPGSGPFFLAPTVEEQLRTLRASALAARGQPFESNTTPERRAAVLEYIANRLEVFARKAAAQRDAQQAPR